jgi:hypothetical protein
MIVNCKEGVSGFKEPLATIMGIKTCFSSHTSEHNLAKIND